MKKAGSKRGAKKSESETAASAFPDKKYISVGELRRGYELRIEQGQELLSAVGGFYHAELNREELVAAVATFPGSEWRSRHYSHRPPSEAAQVVNSKADCYGKPYSSIISKAFIERNLRNLFSLAMSPAPIDALLTALVVKAYVDSGDGFYTRNLVNHGDKPLRFEDSPRDLTYHLADLLPVALIDTALVDKKKAVVYLDRKDITHQHETKHLSFALRERLITENAREETEKKALRGKLSAKEQKRWEAAIEELETKHKKETGKDVKDKWPQGKALPDTLNGYRQLVAAFGAICGKSNKEIGGQLGIASDSTISKLKKKGIGRAKKMGLPLPESSL
jgi:hypothetical protein